MEYLVERTKYLFDISRLHLECAPRIGLAKILKRAGTIIPNQNQRRNHILHMDQLEKDTRAYYKLVSEGIKKRYQSI